MLYIFGDSFSVPDAHKNEVIGPNGLVKFMPLEKNWTSIISESLIGDDNHVNDSALGCSNEYIFHTLRERESSFKSGDCVIVQLTSYYREWIFEDKPGMANFLNAKWVPGVHVTKEQAKALEMYKQYLYSDHRLFIHYDAIFDAITFRTRLYALRGIQCLILPGFQNVVGVQGNMFDASNSEFDSGETCNTYYNKVGGDLRYNHFSEVNHKILADKVIDFFNTGNIMDLTTGFETSIITKDTI